MNQAGGCVGSFVNSGSEEGLVRERVAEQRLLNIALAGQLEEARHEMESLQARVRSYESFSVDEQLPGRPVTCRENSTDSAARGHAQFFANEADPTPIGETEAMAVTTAPMPIPAAQGRDDEVTEYSVGAAARNEQKKAQSRYWKPEEHSRFLEALDKYGPRDVRAISKHVSSRSPTQVRTHAQKYFLRLAKEASSGKGSAGSVTNIEIIRNVSDGDLTKLGREIAAARALKLRQSVASAAPGQQHQKAAASPLAEVQPIRFREPTYGASVGMSSSAPAASHNRMLTKAAASDAAAEQASDDGRPEHSGASGANVYMGGSTCGISLLSLVASQTDAQ
eukprot:CAMPEP_0185844420 /NCGR_PEP_ID=MMETSP1354-20130828/596_1 /TAXON_ID=708628 /ORGANISM="Erythrolobus madagascarensis, Strain CCMP3276" /LENGTH=336 /DNA_ID=CAMNT_0028544085 /DNA_START=257 /DNA_END=1267 /DNA_ORIENTATION=-